MGYYNKFDSTISLGVCYWCVKIPQCGFIGHGLKLITFYVQNHRAALGMCHNQVLFGDIYWSLTIFHEISYLTDPLDIVIGGHDKIYGRDIGDRLTVRVKKSGKICHRKTLQWHHNEHDSILNHGIILPGTCSLFQNIPASALQRLITAQQKHHITD